MPLTFGVVLERVAVIDADLYALLQSIYDQRYTGAVTLHCSEGVPRMAEIPGTRIKLDARNKLDNSQGNPDAVTRLT